MADGSDWNWMQMGKQNKDAEVFCITGRRDNMYDVVIIGSGPAGLSASIYANRAGLKAVTIEKSAMSGGQVLNTYEVDNYPGLPGNKYYEIAKKYLPNGGCGVVSFGLKGGREAASAFMKALRLGAIETHVADARTCCLNPATSTHRQMNDEQLKEAGVPAELIRISLGLEDKVDLIADISNALDAIK